MNVLLVVLVFLAVLSAYLMYKLTRLEKENQTLKGANRFLDGRVRFINKRSCIHGLCTFLSLDGKNWYSYQPLPGNNIVIVGAEKVNPKIVDQLNSQDELFEYLEGSNYADSTKPIDKDLLKRAGLSAAG